MEAFKKYKLRLKELDYPNINALNEEEIIDIFSPNNRNFLLSWIIQQLNPTTIGKDASKLSKIAIGDYFCQQGLCTSSQSQLLDGKNNNINEQIVFFDRTFEHLSELKNSVDICHMETMIQYEDVVKFLAKDVNLFPCFGSIRKYTPEEREDILLSCNQQIGILNEKQNTNMMNFNHEIDFDDPLFGDSSNRRESLKKFINNLNDAVSTIKLNKEEKIIKIEKSVGQDLEKCCQDMDSILQYFKNINLSHEIQEETEAILSTKTDDPTPTLKQLAETFCATEKLLQQDNVNMK